MIATRKARIIGIGSYLPERILSNEDFETMVDTTDDWIVTRTGMKERRIAADDEFSSDMGIAAAKKALADAGCSADDIECIIVATMTPDYTVPGTAPLIQDGLGAKNAAAFDIQAACTGYLYGLSIAKGFIESGMYSKVLLVAPEKMSSIVDYTDRSTCVIFGDGAAGVVVSNNGPGLLLQEICLGADGGKMGLLHVPAGGCRKRASLETVESNLHYIQMNGRETFKYAVRHMEATSNLCLKNAGILREDISWLVPHQANIRIINALAKRFDIPADRVYKIIHKYGNTSASSIGIALDELLKEHSIAIGEHILMTAFGAGLTWGAAIVTKI